MNMQIGPYINPFDATVALVIVGPPQPTNDNKAIYEKSGD